MKMFWLPCCTYFWQPKISVSQQGIYAHVTLSKFWYDSTPIMNPDDKTPENILHFRSRWHDLFLWSCALLIVTPAVLPWLVFLSPVVVLAASSMLRSQGKSNWVDVSLWKRVNIFTTLLLFISCWQGHEFPGQRKTHIVIKSIKFLSL